MKGSKGFTLLELMIVAGIIALLTAVAYPAAACWYIDACLKSSLVEIAEMVIDAKRRVISTDDEHAVIFDVPARKVVLSSSKGKDKKWGTADDTVVRVLRLSNRASLSFGYGACGPPKGLVATDDGVTFPGNVLVCNTNLTGSSGTVYLNSSAGRAMALTMNTSDFGYTLRRWNGKSWVTL